MSNHRFTSDTWIEIPDPDDPDYGMPIYEGTVRNAFSWLNGGNYVGNAIFETPEGEDDIEPVPVYVVISDDGIWCAPQTDAEFANDHGFTTEDQDQAQAIDDLEVDDAPVADEQIVEEHILPDIETSEFSHPETGAPLIITSQAPSKAQLAADQWLAQNSEPDAEQQAGDDSLGLA